MAAALKWAIPTGIVASGLFVLRSAWVALLAYHAFILFAVVGRRWGRRMFGRAGGASIALSKPLVTLFLATMPLTLFGLLLVFRPMFDPAELTARLAGIGLSGGRVLFFAAYLSVTNGLFEEIYWRRLGAGAAREERWVLDDVLYALFHLPVLIPYAPPILWVLAPLGMFVAGSLWRASVARFGHLSPAILSHSACNAAIWIWVLFVIRG